MILSRYWHGQIWWIWFQQGEVILATYWEQLVLSDTSDTWSCLISRTSCKIMISFADKEAEVPRESVTHSNSQRQNQDLNPGSIRLPKPCRCHSILQTLERMFCKNWESTQDTILRWKLPVASSIFDRQRAMDVTLYFLASPAPPRASGTCGRHT